MRRKMPLSVTLIVAASSWTPIARAERELGQCEAAQTVQKIVNTMTGARNRFPMIRLPIKSIEAAAKRATDYGKGMAYDVEDGPVCTVQVGGVTERGYTLRHRIYFSHASDTHSVEAPWINAADTAPGSQTFYASATTDGKGAFFRCGGATERAWAISLLGVPGAVVQEKRPLGKRPLRHHVYLKSWRLPLYRGFTKRLYNLVCPRRKTGGPKPP